MCPVTGSPAGPSEAPRVLLCVSRDTWGHCLTTRALSKRVGEGAGGGLSRASAPACEPGLPCQRAEWEMAADPHPHPEQNDGSPDLSHHAKLGRISCGR